MILAIDPGTTESAFVLYDAGDLVAFDKLRNDVMLDRMFELMDEHKDLHHLAIEHVASYGMAVGREVFATCVWTGRFIQRWGGPFTAIYRADVKIHLCNSMRAKDANIRRAIIDRYPNATGGGKNPAIGIKSAPGPLYGVSRDVWAALGVAITYDETYRLATQRKFEKPDDD